MSRGIDLSSQPLRNRAQIPNATSAAINTNQFGWGWTRWFGNSGAGSHAIVTGATDGPPGTGITTYVRKTWTTAPVSNGDSGFNHTAYTSNVGSGSVANNPRVTPGQKLTVVSWLRTSAAGKSAVGHSYFFYDAANTFLSSTTSTALTLTAGQWRRINSTVTVPDGAAYVGVVTDVDAGTAWAVNDTLDGTGLMVFDNVDDPGAHYDGNSRGWSWTGTVNVSESVGYPYSTYGYIRNLAHPGTNGANWTASTGTTQVSTQTWSTNGGPAGAGYRRRTFTAASTTVGSSSDFFTLGAGLLNGATISATTTAVAGRTYTSSVWVRSSVAQVVRASNQYLSGASGLTANNSASITLVPNVWTRISVTGVAPATTQALRLDVDGAATSIQWAINDTFDVSCPMITEGSILYDFADVNTPGWTAVGTDAIGYPYTLESFVGPALISRLGAPNVTFPETVATALPAQKTTYAVATPNPTGTPNMAIHEGNGATERFKLGFDFGANWTAYTGTAITATGYAGDIGKATLVSLMNSTAVTNLRRNGVQVGSAVIPADAKSEFRVGFRASSGSTEPWQGTISAVLVYPVAHDTATVAAVERWLANKYGIPL